MAMTTNHASGVFFVRTIAVSLSVIAPVAVSRADDRHRRSEVALGILRSVHKTAPFDSIDCCDLDPVSSTHASAGFGFRTFARYVVRGRVPRSSSSP